MPVCPTFPSLCSSVFAAAPLKIQFFTPLGCSPLRGEVSPSVIPACFLLCSWKNIPLSSGGSRGAPATVHMAKPQWRRRGVSTRSLTLSDAPGSIPSLANVLLTLNNIAAPDMVRKEHFLRAGGSRRRPRPGLMSTWTDRGFWARVGSSRMSL